MKNKIFQFLWYGIIIHLIGVDDKAAGIMRVYRRMVWQLRLARLFGAVGAILGDSNGAALAFRRSMRKFSHVTVNIAVPGTTAHDWLSFFSSSEGLVIYRMLADLVIIWNIGGNYALKSEMSNAKYGLNLLHSLFPDSYGCNIPPIYFSILDIIDDNLPTNKSQSEWETEIATINRYIAATWGIKTIDLHTLFTSPVDGGVIPGALKDIVHFSIFSAVFICSMLRHIYGNVDKLLTALQKVKT